MPDRPLFCMIPPSQISLPHAITSLDFMLCNRAHQRRYATLPHLPATQWSSQHRDIPMLIPSVPTKKPLSICLLAVVSPFSRSLTSITSVFNHTTLVHGLMPLTYAKSSFFQVTRTQLANIDIAATVSDRDRRGPFLLRNLPIRH